MWVFAYAASWISTSAAVIAGLYFTNSAWCLWALLLPAMLSWNSSGDGDADEQDKD